MKEIVVISGKGGTGKTSIAASLAVLSGRAVMADCDVDAADMHLLFKHEISHQEDFEGGKAARIVQEQCIQCGLCDSLCRFSAVTYDTSGYEINRMGCDGCGVCAYFCPADAIEMDQKIAGKWFVSETDHGPLVHARLGVSEDNSGKLVTKIRQEAKKIAEERKHAVIIVDGSPGIGCPVIASVTGANGVLIISEPTVSGRHDMARVMELLKYFRIPGMACINKFDINPDLSDEIELFCRENNVEFVGKIPYSLDFVRAQVMAQPLVEYCSGPVVGEIAKIWNRIAEKLL